MLVVELKKFTVMIMMHAPLILVILKAVVDTLKLNVTTTMNVLPTDVIQLLDAFILLSTVVIETLVLWTVVILILVVFMKI
jgi:hypothetical protein